MAASGRGRNRVLGRVTAITCLMVVVACGSDPDSSGSSTTVTTGPSTSVGEETTSTTRAPNPDLAALDGSLADFVARWNALNATVSEQYEDPLVPIAEADFAVGPGPDGRETFVAQVTDSAVLGGLRDPESGQLSSVVVSVDPDGESTAGVVLTLMTVVSTGEVLESTLSTDYRSVALDPRPENLSYTAVGAEDWVIYGVPGASPDDPLVMLVAAPLTDRETASLAAVEAQQAVLGLLASAG